MQLLVSAFSNSQQDQYEIFRRSTFPKSTVRKIMQGVCGGNVPQNAVIAMAGIAKVCVCVWNVCVCMYMHVLASVLDINLQWSLRIKDTLGAMLSFVGRLSSSRRFKMY